MLLQERTASATLEDDEDELEEDEADDGDDRADGPTRIVPRRADEFLCQSCFLCCRCVGSPTRSGSSATTAPDRPRPRVTPAAGPGSRPGWARLVAALGAGVVTGLCFAPVDLGPLVLVVPRAAALGVARARARVTRRCTASPSAARATAW